MEILKGIGLLLFTLTLFSVFSLKAPKGEQAMSGLAGAAVATFLVEAIHKYNFGDFLGIEFLGQVGHSAGSIGGIASATLAGIYMGVNPIYAMAAGAAVSGFGILPGFIAGYLVSLVAPKLEEKLPEGIDVIFGALLIAPAARLIAAGVNPIVDTTLVSIGNMISIATNQSPYIMGFLLGGLMKMICTSPLSAMALTAMLGLTGLPMGIAAIACFGGAFSDGMVFKRLNIGERGNVIGVMLEPLTQADKVTANALVLYSSNFFGGGLAGIVAAYFKIINNAPGTASPIPGMLAPFGFNNPINVIMALLIGAFCGMTSGYIGSEVFKRMKKEKFEVEIFKEAC